LTTNITNMQPIKITNDLVYLLFDPIWDYVLGGNHHREVV